MLEDNNAPLRVGNLGFEKVEFPKPVFIGDTIYAETEVVEKRESKSRPQWGIVVKEQIIRFGNCASRLVLIYLPNL